MNDKHTFRIEKRYLDHTGKISEQILITKIPTATLADDIVSVLEEIEDWKPFDDFKFVVLSE